MVYHYLEIIQQESLLQKSYENGKWLIEPSSDQVLKNNNDTNKLNIHLGNIIKESNINNSRYKNNNTNE